MIKKLTPFIGEYKKQTVLTPLFVMLEVIMDIGIPLIMADLIDQGIEQGNMGIILKYGALLLAAALLALFFGALSGRTAAVASNGFAKNLRRAMYYKVQDYSFSNIDHFSTASIVTRLTTDVSNVQMAFQMLTRVAVRSPGMLVFSFAAAYKIDPKMCLIFVGNIPVLLIGLLFIMKFVHPIFDRVFKNYDKLNNVVQENLYAVRVVKSFNRQKFETDKFKTMSGGIYKDFVKAEKMMAFVSPLMQLCMYTCILLISWIGAKAVIASGNNPDLGLSTGELMSLVTYTMQILMSLMMLGMIFMMLTMARAAGVRIVEILEEESDITTPENPVMEVVDGSVAFEHVDFAYKKGEGHTGRNALNDINLNIASGETVGILGGTGSSKSTLVQMIPRLYDVTSGSVKVGGVDVRHYDLEVLRKQVAMVLQKNVLFSGTIKENLLWGAPDATDEEIQRVCRLACADEFISQMPDGYDSHIEQGGTNVSGGQRQRLCIARALIAKPKILILDDSTSAVDMKTDAMIRKAFAEEIPDTTKIIIAQRVASVQDADKIVVLDDGRIAAVGTHEELLVSSDIYREVYESQNKTTLGEGGAV
ncbi:MAG: ABC transporter ATP-binding protein [Firmicutes bacterium]|nr:ABC transporter ATP-binding protein [Bacillota bacterium]